MDIVAIMTQARKAMQMTLLVRLPRNQDSASSGIRSGFSARIAMPETGARMPQRTVRTPVTIKENFAVLLLFAA